jgi:hypothetical protein
MENDSNRDYYGKRLKQGLLWKKLTLGTCGKTPRKRAAIAEMDMLMHGNMVHMHVDACENERS